MSVVRRVVMVMGIKILFCCLYFHCPVMSYHTLEKRSQPVVQVVEKRLGSRQLIPTSVRQCDRVKTNQADSSSLVFKLRPAPLFNVSLGVIDTCVVLCSSLLKLFHVRTSPNVESQGERGSDHCLF